MQYKVLKFFILFNYSYINVLLMRNKLQIKNILQQLIFF